MRGGGTVSKRGIKRKKFRVKDSLTRLSLEKDDCNQYIFSFPKGKDFISFQQDFSCPNIYITERAVATYMASGIH